MLEELVLRLVDICFIFEIGFGWGNKIYVVDFLCE